MSKQQSQITALVLPDTGSKAAEGSNIIRKYLYYWPLFLLCAGLAIGGAYYYLKVASPVYPITATLKFKTPTSASGGPLTIKENSMEALDPVSNPVIVENELEVMQSKKLIYQIVKDLQLWVNYTQKKGVATIDLYNKTPVLFNFVDSNTDLAARGGKLDITIKDANSFLLKSKGSPDKVYKFGTPIKSAFGTWKLEPTPNFDNSFIGAAISIGIQDPDLVSDSYQGGIKVALENKDAPFVHLSMSDKVPARGKDILNSLITLYRYNAQQEKNEQTQKILGYLNVKVDSLKLALEEEEKNIESYKRNQGITDLSAQTESNRNTKEINSRAVNDLNVQLSTLTSLEQYANSSLHSEKLPAVSENLPDHSLVMLYNKLAELQMEREQKLAITPEANPLFESIDRQMASLKKEFRDRVQSIKATLMANRQQLQSFGSTVQSTLNKVPYQEKEYNALKRDQESKEAIYKLLASKREEIALHYASLIQDSEIVDDAHAGAIKWPKGSIVYGLAFILGLAVAASLIYARENMNDRVTSRKQIEEATEVPILGELAYTDSKDPIVVSSVRSKFIIGEQFRVLRTNLYHLYGGNESGRVTLVTSSISGEGKSFVSSNLAVTLAYASRRTIILEMDLRKPKVLENFGLSAEHPGISNYLNEANADLDLMIRPSGIKGLDVLSCGPILPNPSELLGSEKLDELIHRLQERYDDIIIDSAPIHLVTDALIIARVTQATLYVLRQNYTHKTEFDFINEINKNKRFKKFTLVFNGVKNDGSGYGYNYGNNYYNSYGETEKEKVGTSVKKLLKKF